MREFANDKRQGTPRGFSWQEHRVKNTDSAKGCAFGCAAAVAVIAIITVTAIITAIVRS